MKLTNFNQIQQIALQKVSANRAAEFKTATTLIETYQSWKAQQVRPCMTPLKAVGLT